MNRVAAVAFGLLWVLSLVLVAQQGSELERIRAQGPAEPCAIPEELAAETEESLVGGERLFGGRMSRFSVWEDKARMELLQREAGVEVMTQKWASICRAQFGEDGDGLALEICLFRASMRAEDWRKRMDKTRRERASSGETKVSLDAEEHQTINSLASQLTGELPEWNGKDLEVTGEAARHCVTGEECTFSLKTAGYEFGGESFYVHINGSETTVGTVVDEGGGVYTVQYKVGTVGAYNITILHEFTGYGAMFMPVIDKGQGLYFPYVGTLLHSDVINVTGENVSAPTRQCSSLEEMTYGRFVKKGGGKEERVFQPWNCDLVQGWTAERVATCVNETNLGRVLMLGDSITEHISSSITDRRGFLKHCQLEKPACDILRDVIFLPPYKNVSTVAKGKPRAGWDALLAGEFSNMTLPLEGKRNLVLWNTGLHELVDGDTFADYYLEREEIMERLEDFFPAKQLYRTCTAGHRQVYNAVPKIVRSITNERLRAMDELAALQSRARGHHVIDLYNVTIARPDATALFDVRHYEIGFSALMGGILLNAICFAEELL